MGRPKRQTSVLMRKSAQHILPQFNLSEDSSEMPTTPVHVDSDNQNVAMERQERHLNRFDDNDDDILHDPEVLSSDNEDYVNETTSNYRRKKDTEKEDNDARKKISRFI